MEGVGVMRWLKLCLMVLLVAFVTRCGLHAQHPSEELVIQAKALVEKVKPENTSYRHKNNEVSWGVKGEAVCHADCSGFINALLLHTGTFKEKDFKNHLGTERPLARHYYDAIIHQRGFVEITRIHENSSRMGRPFSTRCCGRPLGSLMVELGSMPRTL